MRSCRCCALFLLVIIVDATKTFAAAHSRRARLLRLQPQRPHDLQWLPQPSIVVPALAMSGRWNGASRGKCCRARVELSCEYIEDEGAALDPLHRHRQAHFLIIHALVFRREAWYLRVESSHSLTYLGCAARDRVKSGARLTSTSFDLNESDHSHTRYEKDGGVPYSQSREQSLTHLPRLRCA
jgi:hypothetical protein